MCAPDGPAQASALPCRGRNGASSSTRPSGRWSSVPSQGRRASRDPQALARPSWRSIAQSGSPARIRTRSCCWPASPIPSRPNWPRRCWSWRPRLAKSFRGLPRLHSEASPSRCFSLSMACVPASPATPCCENACERRPHPLVSRVLPRGSYCRSGPTSSTLGASLGPNERAAVAGVPGRARRPGGGTLYDLGRRLRRSGQQVVDA